MLAIQLRDTIQYVNENWYVYNEEFKSLLRNRQTPPIYNIVSTFDKLLLAWTTPKSVCPSISHLQVNSVHTPPALPLQTRNILGCLYSKLLGLVLEQCLLSSPKKKNTIINHQPKLLLLSCLIFCPSPCFYTQSIKQPMFLFHFILMHVSFPENFNSQEKPAAVSLLALHNL